MARYADSMDNRFARETGMAAQVAALAEPVVEELGFRLVRVNVSGRDGGTVQVMIDRGQAQITVDDCAAVSRRLSPLLDAHDPMPSKYRLEVSSPGIDRPLVRPRDFVTFAGFEAKVELTEMIEGRKRFRGEIEGFEAGEVKLRVRQRPDQEPQIIGLPVALIGQARLVLTEALIRASLREPRA